MRKKDRILDLLDDIQDNLHQRALRFRVDNTFDLDDYGAFKELFEGERVGGFVRAYWCGSAACEEAVKNDTKATIRCIPFEQDDVKGECLYCGGEAEEKVIFAKAY